MAATTRATEVPGAPAPGRRRTRRRWARLGGERGVGPISSLFGLLIFLGFLLLSVQVLTHLYATSALSAAAYDAARLVAGYDGVSTDAAEQHARRLLGDYGEEVRFEWSPSTDDQVVLRVRAPTPAPLIHGLAATVGRETIERTVHVRVEELR